jgi:uncharacterized protein YeaO (DUF488 family)
MRPLAVKRVYLPLDVGDGIRILAEGLSPRGIAPGAVGLTRNRVAPIQALDLRHALG